MHEPKQFIVEDKILATHGQRVANYLLDYIMQLILMFGIFFVGAVIAVIMGYNESEIIAPVTRLSKLGQYALGLVIILIYYNFFEILCTRTIGKFITKTIVVDEYGEKPDANAILLRSICRSICRAIPLEFLTFVGTPCRGWHDSLSKTYVVQKELLDSDKKIFYSFNEIGKDQDS